MGILPQESGLEYTPARFGMKEVQAPSRVLLESIQKGSFLG
jgi:hypothetical protein